MAELKTDRQLLREYAEGGVETAFQALVERHLNLVFATALRGLSDEGAAREVSQNVFIALARKAAWLREEASVAGWLHKTTVLEARLWWRGELRRRQREQTAVELNTLMKDDDSLLKALAGELDEGLLELRDADRQALMLRYFEGRSHREIGVLMGAREDAVRMRIEKALTRLNQVFRRRGYAVPAVAVTIAALGSAAQAAPGGLAVAVTHSALAAGSGGTVTGLELLLARFMALTKTQSAILCVALAATPTAWEWNASRRATQQSVAAQIQLATVTDQQDQSSQTANQLRAESAQLDAALVEARKNQVLNEAAAGKLDVLRTKVRGLLTDPNYHWPNDLPYARVPKTAIKSLGLVHRLPFAPTGELKQQTTELFGITEQEKAPTEQALGNYMRGVDDLMSACAYETNLPSAPGRLTKTVIVPPLGQPLKTLAADTGAQLTAVLGVDREQLLFAGWDEGAIQFFYPGNLWKISEIPQTFSAWVEPAGTGGEPRFGASRSSAMGGTSAEGISSFGIIPEPIAQQFFNPWLEQAGIIQKGSK